ncbi:MAG TPA: O-methyltransferase [Solirubrobacteraceae bacterium]|nr:O-methyltransferase [Solirubrobacteraceae bacterium]
MSDERWDAVDDYITELLIKDDPALDAALRASDEAGLPAIALTPPQAKLLHLIARVHGARRILELGTLGGYSTIWLARALPPDGRLLTLELRADYAAVAAANLQRAGVAERVEIQVGPALESLQALISQQPAPFDLIFVDADKQGTPDYFQCALALSRPGTVIITDNVVRDGAIADPATEDPRALGMRRFHELLAAEPRVSATTIQTVGAKGYDGFTLALVER